MSDEMIRGACDECGGEIERIPSEADAEATCPHCGIRSRIASIPNAEGDRAILHHATDAPSGPDEAVEIPEAMPVLSKPPAGPPVEAGAAVDEDVELELKEAEPIPPWRSAASEAGGPGREDAEQAPIMDATEAHDRLEDLLRQASRDIRAIRERLRTYGIVGSLAGFGLLCLMFGFLKGAALCVLLVIGITVLCRHQAREQSREAIDEYYRDRILTMGLQAGMTRGRLVQHIERNYAELGQVW